MTADLIFVILALLTVVPAVWVVFSPNIVHAGFALLFTLLGVSGLYAYLGADFVAVTQVMVYVGGILVLVLFTVMMTRVPPSGKRRHGLDRYVPAAILALGVFGLLYKAITSVQWAASISPAQPTTAEIGTKLMTDYIFPFEYVSLVLLAAMVGAAILIRERREDRYTAEDIPETVDPDREVTS
ncbi:NADH-quinone oxidoreductase subunit J [bacterium]|nr:MAG: NADH-quinone oxidoreductase subunit J [bacterium]